VEVNHLGRVRRNNTDGDAYYLLTMKESIFADANNILKVYAADLVLLINKVN